MANFSPSNLVNGQALFTEKMQSGEWRLPDSVALQTAVKSMITNPELLAIRTREDRTVLAYYPIRQAAIGSTARAHDHTGARGDSLAVTPSWSIYAEPFSISKKQAGNNVMNWEQMYAASLRNALFNLLSRIDAAFVAALLAAKTGVNSGGGDGEFNGTADFYEVPAAFADYFVQNAVGTLEYNLWRGAKVGILDSKAFMHAQRMLANGGQNATNTAFQFGDVMIYPTTRSIGGSSYNGSGLFFEEGMAAFIPWIPAENRKPLDPIKATSYMGDYGQIELPGFPDIPIAIHAYGTRADNSSSNGATQDETYQFEVSVDMAYVAAPISTFRGSGDSPVYAVGQLI